jgi:hypothetical protein
MHVLFVHACVCCLFNITESIQSRVNQPQVAAQVNWNTPATLKAMAALETLPYFQELELASRAMGYDNTRTVPLCLIINLVIVPLGIQLAFIAYKDRLKYCCTLTIRLACICELDTLGYCFD